MKAEKLYQELKTLAERLDIEVSEQNFRLAGVRVKSGFCTVRGKALFLIDKHKPILKRISILSEFLAEQAYDHVYIVPAVRDHLEKYRPKTTPRPPNARGRGEETA